MLCSAALLPACRTGTPCLRRRGSTERRPLRPARLPLRAARLLLCRCCVRLAAPRLRAALLLTGAAPCAAAAAPPGDPRALHASRSRDSRQPRASVEAAAGFFWASGARGRRKVIEFGTE